MPSLYGGTAPAQMVRDTGSAGAVQNLLGSSNRAISGTNLSSSLPSNVKMYAGGGGSSLSLATLINKIRLGSVTPSKIYLGSTEVSKMYLGNTLVYQS